MKKMLMALVMALLCMVGVCALADGYTMGDKVENFTATLSDGSTFTLSEALKEKKAVLLNFWASWCSPCKMEMPAMNEAYGRLSDEVDFVCLSTEKSDTNDTIAELRESLGLDVLPMGLDSDELYEKFDNPSGGIPFTVVIDKNGVVCFSESGSIPDAYKFIALMNTFTADDYDEPQMVYDLPTVKPNVEAPDEEALRKAIGAEGMEIGTGDDGMVWPFIVSEDGTYAYAGNEKVKDSVAALMVTFEAEAGEGIAFEYAVNAMPTKEIFGVSIGGDEVIEVMAGNKDWTDNVVTFEESGEQSVYFVFNRDEYVDGDMLAAVRNIRKVSAEEAAAILAARDPGVKTLEGETAEIEVIQGEFKDAIVEYNSESGNETSDVKVLCGDSEVKLRIRIGQDVDANYAYISDGSKNIMLGDLEHDDQGYLYTPNSTIDENDIASMLGENIAVFPSILKVQESAPLTSLSYQLSEDTLDFYVEYISALIESMAEGNGIEAPDITWKWADGSEKQVQEVELPSTMNADGTANYTVMVTDKDGRGLENVMVQVCTTETCQLYKTDADGMVQFTDAPYAYEVHILKAPDGYEKPVQTFVMAKEGGSLIVELNAAQ